MLFCLCHHAEKRRACSAKSCSQTPGGSTAQPIAATMIARRPIGLTAVAKSALRRCKKDN
jgi:hypothetical protein